MSSTSADSEAEPLSGGRTAFLLATVFLSGGAVMVVEMTAVRALSPYFGSTTYVWTNVIAVVLAALSVGYAVGGRLADARPSPALLYGLLAVGGTLVMAGAYLVSPVSRWIFPDTLQLEGVAGVLVKGSLVATLVLFAPPTVLLGTISPLAIKLLSRGGVGRAAGRVFSIGTVGSIVGTYLPTLWLVPSVGSRGSLMVAGAMLLVPAVGGLLLFGRGRGRALAAAVLIVSSSIYAISDSAHHRGAPPLLFGGEGEVLEEVESEYQYLTVREDRYPDGRTERILTINEGIYTYHSFAVAGKVLTDSRYYDDYSLLPLLVDVEPGEELRGCVVGLAGGVTTRQWKHFWGGLFDLRIDGAEIDPVVLELGRKHFFIPEQDEPWLRPLAMDGRPMLEAVGEEAAYHMLVVDAFSNELYIPFQLGTLEFFELCESRMAPGGIVAMNVYAWGSEAPNLVALQNTLAKAFGNAVRVQQYWGGNFVLMARKGPAAPDVTRFSKARITARFGKREGVTEWSSLLDKAQRIPGLSRRIAYDESAAVLTDDHAPLEYLTDRMIARSEREALGR